jgi:hypothetical protein
LHCHEEPAYIKSFTANLKSSKEFSQKITAQIINALRSAFPIGYFIAQQRVFSFFKKEKKKTFLKSSSVSLMAVEQKNDSMV